MRKAFTVIILAAFTIMLHSCGSQSTRDQASADTENQSAATGQAWLIDATHQAFFTTLSSLCGQTFEGQQIYRSHHSSGWAHLELVMHVAECTDEHIYIPFRVGDDTSRTWMFLKEEGRLRFRHDHRYPDGTPEEETLYGGYADENGTAFVQYFPADEYTGALIDGGAGNVWTVAISEDGQTFSYRLDRDGEKRLQIDFDLSRPIM